jgi:hypothetical protein
MRRLTVAVPVAALLLVGAPSTGQSESPPTPAAQVVPTIPTVVKRERIYPKRTIRKHGKFTPWAAPSPSQVGTIIQIEAARWGAPAWRLRCRIWGESRMRWGVVNSGGYAGLGQFASSTFYRGMSSIGSRKVKMVKVRWTTRPTSLVRTWSDGHRTRERSKRIRVKVVHTYYGKIPRWPARTHGWAQVRIMARAMVGKGRVHDSEWQVRC